MTNSKQSEESQTGQADEKQKSPDTTTQQSRTSERQHPIFVEETFQNTFTEINSDDPNV